MRISIGNWPGGAAGAQKMNIIVALSVDGQNVRIAIRKMAGRRCECAENAPSVALSMGGQSGRSVIGKWPGGAAAAQKMR